MKYILIIVICFMGLATKAQVQKQGRSNFPTVVDSSLAIGKNFILPVFRSFSQLATYTNLDSSGRLVFIRDSNAVFYRTNAHTWAKLSTGSGSGSVAWGSITGTLSNQTDLQTVLDSKVDSVILRGGDSLYNHYATGEVQFIGLLSGGSVSDTLIVTFPLYVNETNDTLSIPQASTDSSGYLSASDWNYFAVKPDSTVLNATGDTLLSYLGSTVIYSKAIAGGSSGWSLTGNAGTDPTINFLGTTDAQPLYLRVNNDTIAKFGTNTGNVSIGLSTSSATGVASIAMAGGNAMGEAAIALGQNTAMGDNSFAIGGGTSANGYTSTAMGASTTAVGESSTSMGFSTFANGDKSTAMGDATIAKSKNSLVIGRYNDTTSQTNNDTTVLFQIGNGYQGISTTVLSNLLTATYTGVGIGTTTPIAKLHIASTDTFALVVTGMGNSVVGTDSAVVRDINGNFKVAAKSSSGSFDSSNLVTKTATQTVLGATTFANTTVGSANTTVTGGRQGGSDNVGLLVNGTFAGATNAHSLRVTPAFAPTSNGFAMAGIDIPMSTSGIANINHMVNVQSTITHGSSGTLTNIYNSYSGFTNNGGVTTNRYGFYAVNAAGSGTVTNQYMYYAEDPTKGGTLNYAFFAAGAGKLGLTTGTAELGGSAIIGFGTGTAPGGVLEVRKNGANSLRLRNNANWFQWTQPSGSADISFGSISGNNMKIYDGGNKTFFAPGGDSVSNSGLWVNHSFALAYNSTTSSSFAINANHSTINCDATSTTITATLPTAVGCKGRIYTIRKSDASANLVTVATTSSQTIDGATTYTGLTVQYKRIQVQSDGANWMIISNN